MNAIITKQYYFIYKFMNPLKDNRFQHNVSIKPHTKIKEPI